MATTLFVSLVAVAAVEMKLLEIEEGFPAYAAYLKSQR